jgi:hypothetical protein
VRSYHIDREGAKDPDRLAGHQEADGLNAAGLPNVNTRAKVQEEANILGPMVESMRTFSRKQPYFDHSLVQT